MNTYYFNKKFLVIFNITDLPHFTPTFLCKYNIRYLDELLFKISSEKIVF
jgi:hypothetical protein